MLVCWLRVCVVCRFYLFDFVRCAFDCIGLVVLVWSCFLEVGLLVWCFSFACFWCRFSGFGCVTVGVVSCGLCWFVEFSVLWVAGVDSGLGSIVLFSLVCDFCCLACRDCG